MVRASNAFRWPSFVCARFQSCRIVSWSAIRPRHKSREKKSPARKNVHDRRRRWLRHHYSKTGTTSARSIQGSEDADWPSAIDCKMPERLPNVGVSFTFWTTALAAIARFRQWMMRTWLPETEILPIAPDRRIGTVKVMKEALSCPSLIWGCR